MSYNAAMRSRLLTALPPCLSWSVLVTAGCARTRDVEKDLKLIDVQTGWYDAGIVEAARTSWCRASRSSWRTSRTRRSTACRSTPSSAAPTRTRRGASTSSAPSAPTGSTPARRAARWSCAPRLATPARESRAQMLQNQRVRRRQGRVFGKHGSRTWVKLGEYTVERQLLTRVVRSRQPARRGHIIPACRPLRHPPPRPCSNGGSARSTRPRSSSPTSSAAASSSRRRSRRAPFPSRAGSCSTWVRRRRARVCGRDGLRRTGGAAAARRRRVRLPARRVRPARRLPDRLDVVRRRVLRRHRHQRRRARRSTSAASFPARRTATPFLAVPILPGVIALTFSPQTADARWPRSSRWP